MYLLFFLMYNYTKIVNKHTKRDPRKSLFLPKELRWKTCHLWESNPLWLIPSSVYGAYGRQTTEYPWADSFLLSHSESFCCMRTDLPCMLGRLHSFRGSREYRVQGFLLFYDRILYMAALVYTWLSPLKKKRPRIGAFSRKNCTKERIRLENDLLMEAAELHGQKLLLPRCAPE